MNNNKLLLALLFGGMLWYFTRNNTGNSLSINQKKDAILSYMNSGGDSSESKLRFVNTLNSMLPDEVESVFLFIFNFIQKGLYPQQGTPLYNQIQAISAKYNIFT